MPEESDQCLQQHKYDQIVIWLTKGHAINKSSWLEIRFFFVGLASSQKQV